MPSNIQRRQLAGTVAERISSCVCCRRVAGSPEIYIRSIEMEQPK